MMARTILFAFTAMLLYAGWAFLAKIATNSIPAEEAVIYTYIAGLLVASGYLHWHGDSVVAAPRGMGFAIVGGLFLGGGTIAYYLTLSGGSAAIATSISGMYLLGTTVLAVAFLGESLSRANVAGIVLALGAIVLLVR